MLRLIGACKGRLQINMSMTHAISAHSRRFSAFFGHVLITRDRAIGKVSSIMLCGLLYTTSALAFAPAASIHFATAPVAPRLAAVAPSMLSVAAPLGRAAKFITGKGVSAERKRHHLRAQNPARHVAARPTPLTTPCKIIFARRCAVRR